MTTVISGRLFRYAHPALFGELAIMLWLLVGRVRPGPRSQSITR